MGIADTRKNDSTFRFNLKCTVRSDPHEFPHGMHLPGQHFCEIGNNGTLGLMRDTILVFQGETREIAFAAGNPGRWLFRCHTLSHQDSGMKTWIEVRI